MLNKTLKKTLVSVFFIAWGFSNLSFAKPSHDCPNLSILDNSKIQSGIVDWLPDGDTIHTKKGKKLRLLHINTPEINPTTNKPAQPFSKAAKKRLAELIGASNKIFWITDHRQQDKYKRDLVYVFNSEGEFLNAKLVSEGLAHTLVIPPNTQYWKCIVKAEKKAYNNQLGIWSHPKFQPKAPIKIKANRGFQLVSGKITQIINSKKYRWLILDEYLWVGIKRKDFHNFRESKLDYKIGETIIVRGYAYFSYDKLRMKLKHPAMIFK